MSKSGVKGKTSMMKTWVSGFPYKGYIERDIAVTPGHTRAAVIQPVDSGGLFYLTLDGHPPTLGGPCTGRVGWCVVTGVRVSTMILEGPT